MRSSSHKPAYTQRLRSQLITLILYGFDGGRNAAQAAKGPKWQAISKWRVKLCHDLRATPRGGDGWVEFLCDLRALCVPRRRPLVGL